jgi:MFS family permease
VRKNILVVGITTFMLVASWCFWWYVLPIYLRELKATDFQVSISYFLLHLFFALGNGIGGILVDKFGRKRIVVTTSFCLFIFFLLSSRVQEWNLLVSLLILTEFFAGIQTTGFISITAESTHTATMGNAFGITGMAFSLGVVIGPLLGAMVMRIIKVSWLIFTTGIISFVCGIIHAKVLKETEINTSLHASKIQFNRNLLFLLLSSICLFIVFNLTSWGPFIALYAKDSIGLGKPDVNLLFFIGGTSAVIFSVPGGKVIDKLGGKIIFMVGAILFPLSFIPWLFTKNVISGGVFFGIAYLFSQSAYTAYRVLVAKIAPQKMRAKVIGIFGTITGGVGAFAPIIGILIQRSFGIKSPFFLAVGVGIVATFCLLFYNQK